MQDGFQKSQVPSGWELLQELKTVPGRGVLGLGSVAQRFFNRAVGLSRGLDRDPPEYEVIHKDFK